VVEEVTGRHSLEVDRGPSEGRFRAIFEATSEAIGISARGLHLLVNPAYARLFGYARPGELHGLPVLDLIASAERTRIAAFIQSRGTPESGPDSYETKGRRADGSEFEMEARVSTYLDGGQRFTVVALRDVSEQRAVEARIVESERRYRELFEQIPVGVIEEDLSGAKRILDGLGLREPAALRSYLEANPAVAAACVRAVRVLAINPAAAAMTGAKVQVGDGTTLDQILAPEALAELREATVQLWAGRQGVRIDGWRELGGGQRRWIGSSSHLAAGSEQSWSRGLVTLVDQTDRRLEEEERSALRERLREAEKLEALGRLAGGVAHDFNNILTSVLGFAELTLESTEDGTAVHEAQLRIREAALRARDLVKQVLLVGRRSRPELRPVDVARVVLDALALARAAIPANVALETRVDLGAGVALIDPTQLHQIVLNLCSNARDAVGLHGRIEVELSAVERTEAGQASCSGEADRCVRLRVRDDGVGIDDATRARLFEPYMTTKAATGGHGLGLAVVRGIVTAAGGSIRVDSAPGRGSRFDVYLPRLEGVAPQASPPPVEAPRGQERILVVDDEPSVRAVHARLLRTLGYEVAEADGAREAVRLLRTPGPPTDLVLTDQTMPEATGAELAEAIAAEWPRLPVILCSGYSEAIGAAQARELGLAAVVAKPIERTALAVAIRRALDGVAAEPQPQRT
jgi:PAS domain S-box-containing protein